MFDTLTSTLNQKAFLRFSSGELERARRGQTPFSLIALDIDDFKASMISMARILAMMY